MSLLIVYYSYGGNTGKIAEEVHAALGGDIAEIRTATPYTGTYDEVVDQGQREVETGFKPQILPLGVSVDGYDDIIIGTPVWWYTFAPAVKTFLEANKWEGKRVYPFATNGGWIGHTSRDFASSCAGAKVERALNIRFDGDRQVTPESAVEKWVEEVRRKAGGTM